MSIVSIVEMDPLLHRVTATPSLARVMAILVICIVTSHIAQGQAVTAMGSGVPRDSIKADWYLDTLSHRTWQRLPKKWKRFSTSPANSIKTCGPLLLFQGEVFLWLTSRVGKVIVPGQSCECNDSLIQICNSSFCYYLQDTAIIAWSEGSGTGSPPYLKQPTMVGGERGYCATVSLRTLRSQGMENIHGWGVLGMDGSWLIEPKYDAAFRFQNGFADVVYYGQKRKINEKGEFVE